MPPRAVGLGGTYAEFLRSGTRSQSHFFEPHPQNRVAINLGRYGHGDTPQEAWNYGLVRFDSESLVQIQDQALVWVSPEMVVLVVGHSPEQPRSPRGLNLSEPRSSCAFQQLKRNDYLIFGRNTVLDWFRPESDVHRIRAEIDRLVQLPPDWDSYGSEAPTGAAISCALQVVDALCSVPETEVAFEWVQPTADRSVLLQHRMGSTTLRWEIDSDGDLAVMVRPREGEPRYHDLQIVDAKQFLHSCVDGD